MDDSIGNFIDLYSSRKNSNKEYWLLDISSWSSMNDVLEDLQSSKLDLDDDFYMYSLNVNEKIIGIWEYYEVHYSRPRKLLPYGNWSEEVLLIISWINNQEQIFRFFFCKLQSGIKFHKYKKIANIK